MHLAHVVRHVLVYLVPPQLKFAEETPRYVDKGVPRPRVEEVDRGAVNQPREATGTDAERFSDGGEAQHGVEVGADAGDEERGHMVGHVGDRRRLGRGSEVSKDPLHVFREEEVWYPTAREDTVDVDEEMIVDDLCEAQVGGGWRLARGMYTNWYTMVDGECFMDYICASGMWDKRRIVCASVM